MKRRPLIILSAVALLSITLVGCAEEKSADNQVEEMVQDQNKIYADNQPMPIYDYSGQRDVLIQIYNNTVPVMPDTWTVFLSQMGTPISVCASKGMPLPYGAQLTNAEYETGPRESRVTLPQAEPNGLWITGSTDASWVLCDFGGGIEPVYSESPVIAFTHPVSVENNQIVHHTDRGSSVTINLQETPEP